MTGWVYIFLEVKWSSSSSSRLFLLLIIKYKAHSLQQQKLRLFKKIYDITANNYHILTTSVIHLRLENTIKYYNISDRTPLGTPLIMILFIYMLHLLKTNQMSSLHSQHPMERFYSTIILVTFNHRYMTIPNFQFML